MNNICHFIPYNKDYNSIHTVNFVLETNCYKYCDPKAESLYKVHYVSRGKGYLHTLGKTIELEQGDVFFTFPAFYFSIESVQDFEYMYISFLGARGNQIMDKFGISANKYYFKDCGYLGQYWQNGIEFDSEFSDLMSESVLLHTFSYLGSKLTNPSPKKKYGNDTALCIKKYIDDNFTNSSLSLETISEELSYNKKYISSVFKKSIGIGLIEYLNIVRIQYACTLIGQGFKGMGDISACCGYSDPQYFSKVFKKIMKIAPTAYIKNQ